MELPNDLQTALSSQTADINIKKLLDAAQNISLRYRQRDNTDNIKAKHFIQNDIEALAYAISRMPATYGAVHSAIKYTLDEIDNQSIDSVVDIGAGTGAAVWATDELIDLDSVDSIVCVEYDSHMRNLGKALMANASEPFKSAKWESLNIVDIGESMPFQADLIIASYIMNELDENIQLKIAEKLWCAAKKMLIFVETGTPDGYRLINKIRTKLLEQNAKIIAPCFHQNMCPVAEKESNWCHFTCRVQRNRLHKLAKGGDAPYEDEKYTYLALAKSYKSCENSANYGRILRHPQINKGHVRLDLCTKDGLKQAMYSKRDGDVYKSARKLNCGDKINLLD